MKDNFSYRLLWRFITITKYRNHFYKIGGHTTIFEPLQLNDVSSIVIGNYVSIAKGAWLYGSTKKKKTLIIMDGTRIGHFVHVVAMNGIRIGKNVLIADRVFISDCSHSFDDPEKPILEQKVVNLHKVDIGDDSWIGENVCILGVTIGRHCVIGANSVVKKDIPDYCVAAGNPAKIIKRYNFQSREWEKV